MSFQEDLADIRTDIAKVVEGLIPKIVEIVKSIEAGEYRELDAATDAGVKEPKLNSET